MPKTLTKDKKMPIVHSPKDLPKFKSEAEEAAFWDSHEMGEGFYTGKDAVEVPLRTSARNISLRLDTDTEMRLRKLASIKHKGYQTLLKEFVLERIYEEEKRVGIL